MPIVKYPAMHTLTIELLRVGKPHDHALSKKIKYIALCGSHPPVDFSINCDQDTFINYKKKIRYFESNEQERQEGIHFFENLITKILDDIEPLRIEGQTEDWLHIRLVMTPKELAQLPFELALTPKGFQGQHSKKFLLNPQRLTTLTREVRQVASTRYSWPHKPRVLFAYAEPEDKVPHEDHFAAIRNILKYFAIPINNNIEPVPDLVPLITILRKASLKSINEAIKAGIEEKQPYTFIHILAHGSRSVNGGSEMYKLILHENNDINKSCEVDGDELANAILATDGNRAIFPAIVSLMACDSSNEGSIFLPAGSLAHQIHQSGVPCVFASQFPLSTKGSVILVETLYRKLLVEGLDPRKALYHTRMELFNTRVHDWASLVSYVRFPEDIDEQLKDNYLEILLQSMKTSGAWADHVLKYSDELNLANKESLFDDINNRLDESIKNLKDLFQTDINRGKERYAEHFGLLGSAYKRKSEHLFRMADIKEGQKEAFYKESKTALLLSREWFLKGYEQQINHWTAIQYLSLTAIITGSLKQPADNDIWTITRILAEDNIKENNDPINKIWAWGTLSELYLLSPLKFSEDLSGIDKEIIISAKKKALQYFENIAKAEISFINHPVNIKEKIQFALESTLRQFKRYIEWWPVLIPSASTKMLKESAEEIINGVI